MTWFVFALFTAFFAATEAAVLKKHLGDLEPLDMAAYPLCYSLPFFLGALLVMEAPRLTPDFWPTIFVLLPINLLAVVLYNVAIRLSPLSLTMPFLAFTPVLAIGTGYLLLGETVRWAGVFGILAVVAGSYVLQLEATRAAGILGPFRAIFKEKGSVIMLVVAAIFGLTAVLGKKVLLHSSPRYAGMLFFSLHNAVFLLLFVCFRAGHARQVLARPGSGLVVGTLFFGQIACHFTALALVATAYMIAVKRISGLFSVVYAGLWLREAHFRIRLLGAGLMSLGAGVIVVWG